LRSLNFKFNPLAREITYYKRVLENVPMIEFLDDEKIEPGFFEKKEKELKNLKLKQELRRNKILEVSAQTSVYL
jgi:hypothetical protein